MNYGDLTLGHLGELRLIEEVVLTIAKEYDAATDVGDDCAYFPTDGRVLAVTADVGPKPLLQSLPGCEMDFEAAGWLAVVATASDVATAGAQPLFLTNCIDAPSDFRVADFARYLKGYFSACVEFGFRNGGGDVRLGPNLAMRVFGAGLCLGADRIGRRGIRPGDHLMVVGPTGEFMAHYLQAVAKARPLDASEIPKALARPRPRLIEMRTLAEHGLVVAASDTSDGLLGAIDNLARASRCGFELTLGDHLLPDVVVAAATVSGYGAWNVFFAWGDWSVAIAVCADDRSRFEQLCKRSDIGWAPLGVATAGASVITVRLNGGGPMDVNTVRNENFVSSGFNSGIQGHLHHMLATVLFSARRSFDG